MASERDAEDTLQLQPSEHGPLVCLNSMKLKELPRLAEAAHCHAATAFAAQFNYIAALDPEVFGPFQQLQYLALGGNELREVPDLRFAPQVRELHLNNNKLQAIAGLEALPHLQVLDLRGNRLTRVGGLASTTSLRRLSLACNQLEGVDANGLPEQWPEMEFCSVYANYLSNVADVLSLARRMPAATELQISGNPCCRDDEAVLSLAPDVVAAAPALQWLDGLHCGSVAQGGRGPTASEAQRFLDEARAEAAAGLAEGGIPIGSVLVHRGTVIGRGHNRRIQSGSPVLHGEMDALENAGRQAAAVYQECTLYTTLSPCAMCSGAILLYKIPRVVVGENLSFTGEEELLRSRGVCVTVAQDPGCIAMMDAFIRERPELWNEDIGV